MIFNEIAGSFNDTLTSEIKGLMPKQFPIELFIRGSPLKIPTDQVGLKISEFPYLLDFGGMLLNSKPLTKTLKFENIGTRFMKLQLRIYSLDTMKKDRDEFKISIADPIPGSGKLALVKFNPLQPPSQSDIPFSVDTSEVVISPKSSVIFTVTYTSDHIQSYNSVIVAKPTFQSGEEDSHSYEMEELAVRLKASTFLPKIDLLKNPNLFGDIEFKFEK